MVAETSMRPMRSDNFGAALGGVLDVFALVTVAVALMLISLQGAL
jgi:hypothetical protein